jgi:hypothetical protein
VTDRLLGFGVGIGFSGSRGGSGEERSTTISSASAEVQREPTSCDGARATNANARLAGAGTGAPGLSWLCSARPRTSSLFRGALRISGSAHLAISSVCSARVGNGAAAALHGRRRKLTLAPHKHNTWHWASVRRPLFARAARLHASQGRWQGRAGRGRACARCDRSAGARKWEANARPLAQDFRLGAGARCPGGRARSQGPGEGCELGWRFRARGASCGVGSPARLLRAPPLPLA